MACHPCCHRHRHRAHRVRRTCSASAGCPRRSARSCVAEMDELRIEMEMLRQELGGG